MFSCCESGCQLCQKQAEVNLMKGRKRDLSLNSMYRHDYHHKLVAEMSEAKLPIPHKNDSSNVQRKRKSYFDTNSTYLDNYKPTNPEVSPRFQLEKQPLRQQQIESYISTYNRNHINLPCSGPQQSFKIADPDLRKRQSSFQKTTQYNHNYRAIQKEPTVAIHHQRIEAKNPIRLFETTQKSSYKGQRHSEANLPVIPVNNISTLPSSPSQFTSSYKNDYANRPIEPKKKERSHLSQYYRFD